MTVRRRIEVRGAVQGVGFRPFAHRLALQLGLAGWVSNSAQGATVEVEGPLAQVSSFAERIRSDLPPPGRVEELRSTEVPCTGESGFLILQSESAGDVRATVLPDLATCHECRAELFDPSDRRYRYPFLNCTHCGPRATIVRSLPYDRPNTTMAGFPLCPDCEREYRDPGDRRFHAQPIACPACGPRLELWTPEGEVLPGDPLQTCVRLLQSGLIAAIKGVGGFHLMVDAQNQQAVLRLRERKHREAKPFAVLIGNLDEARVMCHLETLEEEMLVSPEAPIVLVQARPGVLAASVAPDLATFGLFLASNPLHLLLCEAFGGPLVATSGNLSDEPICTDELEALQRFRDIADVLLVHNRPIARPMDDSIVRSLGSRPTVIRRARGLSPAPITLSGCPRGVLAVGAHQKNAPALGLGDEAVVAPHVGDLDTSAARERLRRTCDDLSTLYECPIESVVHDLHPDYGSTRLAESLGLPLRGVQHHVSHAAACLAEHKGALPALAVVWDGTGYGPDGTIWGGEFFLCSPGSIRRIARLKPFSLPGGEAAVREGRRSALGVLSGSGLKPPPHWVAEAFLPDETRIVQAQIRSAAITSSAGRLFDAAASLTAGLHRSRYEGEAAMRFEALAREALSAPRAEVRLSDEVADIDWEPAMNWALAAEDPGEASSRFHAAMAALIASVAAEAAIESVALSGGCFQNRLLVELTGTALEAEGHRVILHQRIPPNDGGIAFGQLAALALGWI